MFHTSGKLFKNAFGTEEMREVFTEEAYAQHFMEVEAALARAEADAGLIPQEAADEITRTASLDYLDLDEVEQKIAEIDLFTVAIIQTWKEAIGPNGEYIHWGATSQDIADMAMFLLMRDGFDVLKSDIDQIKESLEDLTVDHADTPMMGRTHHVHALPITFGLKSSNWLDEFTRVANRLQDTIDRVSVLQFFGAVGSLASIGEPGLEVQENLAAELDVTIPNTAWYASRDRLVELLDVFASLGDALSRIARQILVLGREEIDEVSEPIPEGMVGSSTMPHKRNPVKSERTIGLAALLRGKATAMHLLTDAYDERDAGLWYAEYAVIPEAFLYLSRALRNMREVVGGLEINRDRMRSNMDIHDGLPTSEAVMMELADSIGRQTAHEVVYEAATETMNSGQSFFESLLADERITNELSEEELRELTDPSQYTGISSVFAERTAENTKGQHLWK